MKFTLKPSRPIITSTQIKNHLNSPRSVSWFTIQNLIKNTLQQCVDGRSKKRIIGTPGGNMGEFILSLDAAEKVTGLKIRPSQILRIFNQYLKLFGAFYMHTDTHALNHLQTSLQKHPAFKKYKLTSLADLIRIIKNPNKSIQPIILEYLIKPANIGCGHLKLMLTETKEYLVRKEVIQTAIRAYFHALWGNKKLDYTILKHDHHEGAVVTVLVANKKITSKTPLPAIAPAGNNIQMFISHPQAESFMRTQVAKTIVDRRLINGITAQNKDQYLQTIISRGSNLTRLTLSHLALGLPHYTAVFKT